MISERNRNNGYLNKCFNGEKLFGDDFTYDEILEWYELESQAYANMVSKNEKKYKNYTYEYHELNKYNGYRFLPYKIFKNTLSLGAAYGDELLPIYEKIENITIIESGEIFKKHNLKSKNVTYVKPNPSGKIPFDNDTFDLFTCLGVLHHIPNVSYVLSEIYRVLKPGAFALIREPTSWMGDWRKKRMGLTPCERGIPYDFLLNHISRHGYTVVSERRCCHTLSYGFMIKLKLPFFCSNPFLSRLDYYFSRIFFRQYYHPKNFLKEVQPSSVYLVLRK